MVTAIAEIFVGTRNEYSDGAPISGEELCCAVRVDGGQIMNDKNLFHITCAMQFQAKFYSFVAVMRLAKVSNFVVFNGRRLRQSDKEIVECSVLPVYMITELSKFLVFNGFVDGDRQ